MNISSFRSIDFSNSIIESENIIKKGDKDRRDQELKLNTGILRTPRFLQTPIDIKYNEESEKKKENQEVVTCEPSYIG